MRNEPVYMTAEGLEKLQAELTMLRDVKRPEVAMMIKDAKDAGDISENAGYDEAKEKQAFVEGRIQELESLVKRAKIIKDAKGDGTIVVGSRVTVEEIGEDSENFRIVGSAEADPTKGTISNESPLGKALIGQKAGGEVEITTPNGSALRFKVIKVA